MKDYAEALVERLSKKYGNDRTDLPEIRQYSVANAERSGALAVKTPGGGFVKIDTSISITVARALVRLIFCPCLRKRIRGNFPDVEVASGGFLEGAVQLSLYGTFELEHQQDYRFDW